MKAILEFFKDPNDSLSSKRLIGILAALNTFAFVWVFVFLGKLDASTGLYTLGGMVGAGIFGATADHWGPK